MKHFLFALLLLSAALSAAAQELHLLPQPLHVERRQEPDFRLAPTTVIAYDDALERQALYLRDLLRRSTGFDLRLQRGGKKGIVLRLDPGAAPAEGYRLRTDRQSVTIAGSDPAGAFYGIQTLLQLLPPAVYSDRLQTGIAWTVPAVEIDDAPNRPWRGMMLDVARYFYDVDFVKRFIDLMAHYKLNKLQFHLIDDSGWRLEIKKYPRLTQVGAWAGANATRMGGFYTQEEMRELIDYAQVRGVEIIPEIEFPAHILSAVVAYPWLSCTEQQHQVPTQHFISRDLLCVGKESSFEFLQNVLAEVVALFPSPVINIGGDEAVYERWAACPHCQALMKKEGIARADDLQGWLTNRVAKMMRQHGRTCMGWEEIILRGKVDEPVIALFWHSQADSIHATRSGHKGVLTPATHLYFDFPEDPAPGEVQAATWMPPISLEKVYSMPMNDYSPQGTVLGAQGCYWTDQFIHGDRLREIEVLDENRSERYAEYLNFPRIIALSEICWLPQARRSWERFSAANDHNYRRLDALNVNYRLPAPRIVSTTDNADLSTTFTLAPGMSDSQIVYTTDGTRPHRHSKRYTAPVTIDDKEKFQTATLHGHRVSLPAYIAPDYSAHAALGTFVGKARVQTDTIAVVNESYDLSGKINGNGRYVLAWAEEGTAQPSTLLGVEVWKRDERIAVLQNRQTGAWSVRDEKGHPIFDLSVFEAGTPFTLRVVRKVQPGRSQLLFFIRKP